ncbi:MAG: hypothetical protein NT135_02185 [Candidatus Berkelbacteria bacterium]|nr:hypothetical protein [Candidatus Berkelbacteria bacterium]
MATSSNTDTNTDDDQNYSDDNDDDYIWTNYDYELFCKLTYITNIFKIKEEIDWAYSNRKSLAKMTADDLYETSPFFECDDLINPPHIRFATIKVPRCKRKRRKEK